MAINPSKTYAELSERLEYLRACVIDLEKCIRVTDSLMAALLMDLENMELLPRDEAELN